CLLEPKEGGLRMKRILVAVDASPRAVEVLDAGIDVARKMGAKVRLFRAVGIPPELPANLFAMPADQLVDVSIERAKRELEELARRVPPEILDGCTAQVGVAWDAICSYAREHDVDLIVVGSHGAHLIERVIGTTASKVVNHADRSVLVVRGPRKE